MAKDVFDEIRRVPVNRVAADVVSTGVHFERQPRANCPDRREPYPTRPIPDSPSAAVGRQLVGKRYGKMLVVGLARDVPKRWVVRCACGMYTLRRLGAITNPLNNNDSCDPCHYVLERMALQAGQVKGRKVNIDELPGQHRPGERYDGPNAIDQAKVRDLQMNALPPQLRKQLRLSKEERRQICETNRRNNLKQAPKGNTLADAFARAQDRAQAKKSPR